MTRITDLTEARIERLWRAVKPESVVTPEYVKDLITKGGAKDPGLPHPNASYTGSLPFHYEDSMPEFHNDGGQYPSKYAHLKSIPYEDVVEHPEYPDALTQVSLEHFGWARENFDKGIKLQNGAIRAWRHIEVDEKTARSLLHGRSLGIYWTYDPDSYSGQGFWAPMRKRGLVSVRLEALVPQTSVDWRQTYIQNMDWFHGMSEAELRLIPGSPLKLVRMEIGSKKMPASPTGKWTA